MALMGMGVKQCARAEIWNNMSPIDSANIPEKRYAESMQS